MGGPVSHALEQLESRIHRSGAGVSQPDAWPEVEAVAANLDVIWWNLLANALEHAGERPRIELGWQKEDARIRFWVSDAGPGVAEAALPKLFHPFETLHERNSSRGLGLSIVRRLVELEGGTCGHEPGATGGSVFSFSLPAPRES